MRKLRASILRHKIIIQREQISKDDLGDVVKIWVNIKITRASIDPITGSEWFAEDRMINDVDQSITLRKTDLIAADRIIFQGRIFDVKRVLDFENRGIFFLVLAKERVSEKYASASRIRTTESGDTLITESGDTRITED